MQERKVGSITWVDLIHPTQTEMDQIISRFGFPPSISFGCIDPDHLPNLESTDDTHFLILRAFDLEPKSDQSTIQAMTRKIAIAVKPDIILTVHRFPQPYLQSLFDSPISEKKLLSELVIRIMKTYDVAITEINDEFDEIEDEVLEQNRPIRSQKVQDLYTLKRRVTLLKRLLRMTRDPIREAAEELDLQLASDQLDKSLFQLEEVYDNLIAILSLQVSISAQRANEIMRVLTVYSIIFMPLNLIAGIYGMNFEHMPEIKWEHGYPMVLVGMFVVISSILIWLKRRGWLNRP